MSKDQAIAPKPPQIAFEHYWIKTRNPKKARHELQRHPLQPQVYVADNANRHWMTWKAAQSQQQPAQPDCRTCKMHMTCLHDTTKRCTNGDKYEAAPRVVLWRTE